MSKEIRKRYNFNETETHAVWRKGKKAGFWYDFLYKKDEWRKDICGDWIRRSHYGRRDSKYGWEIDHIKPVSRGGSDNIDNLQPLQWRNNAEKSDSYPWKPPRKKKS